MLLYDFELIPADAQTGGETDASHLRLSFDNNFSLAPVKASAREAPKEFATLEEVRDHMQRENLRCRYVFASECAYGMGFDEAFFKDLVQR